jgi:hypothetical protein
MVAQVEVRLAEPILLELVLLDKVSQVDNHFIHHLLLVVVAVVELRKLVKQGLHQLEVAVVTV